MGLNFKRADVHPESKFSYQRILNWGLNFDNMQTVIEIKGIAIIIIIISGSSSSKVIKLDIYFLFGGGG